MKLLIILVLVTFAYAYFDPAIQGNSAYGYIQKYAIPLAEKIRHVEEKMSQQKIVGGVPAAQGAFPYQAGLLASYFGISGTGVCGGSLVSANRVLTAAHCWFDGVNQAWLVTVVLGSNTIFTGGIRQHITSVITHPNWLPTLARNDVAVIQLPVPVTFSNTISPIALPSGFDLNEDFADEIAVASGFGLTSDGGSISSNQFLSHVELSVIPNSVCFYAFPLYLHDSNLCTSSIGGTSVCSGDSGGPLVVTRNNRPVLIGITSFGSPLGCEVGIPAVFARVTSFMDFFNQHI